MDVAAVVAAIGVLAMMLWSSGDGAVAEGCHLGGAPMAETRALPLVGVCVLLELFLIPVWPTRDRCGVRLVVAEIGHVGHTGGLRV